MFSETGKSFGRENDSSGIVDSCPGSGRPHTVHPIAKISKAKDLALILAYEVFMFCQRSIFSNRFLTLFTHSRLMRRSVVNPVVLMALLLMSFLHRC